MMIRPGISPKNRRMGLRFLPDPSGSGEASAERSVSVFTVYRVSGSPPGTMRRILDGLARGPDLATRHDAESLDGPRRELRDQGRGGAQADPGPPADRRHLLDRAPEHVTGGAVRFFCVQRDLRRRERGAHVVDRGDSEAIRPDDSELAGGRPQDPDALFDQGSVSLRTGSCRRARPHTGSRAGRGPRSASRSA